MHPIKMVLLSSMFYKLQTLPELMHATDDQRLNLSFALYKKVYHITLRRQQTWIAIKGVHPFHERTRFPRYVKIEIDLICKAESIELNDLNQNIYLYCNILLVVR